MKLIDLKSIDLKNSKRVVIVIPCRVFSTRLLAKPLQRIGEFTILELLIKQLKKSKIVNEIVLAVANSIGSDLFVEFAQKNKLKYVFGSEQDVLGRFLKAGNKFKADVIVRVTSENPFIFWEGIDNLIKKHIEGDYDISCNSRLPVGSGFEVINLKSLKIAHKKGNKWHKEHCTPYLYENPKKFKILKLSLDKILERSDIRLTVDTPQDLLVARKIYEKLGKRGKPIQLKKIIKFLDQHPEIKKINSNLKHKKIHLID